MQSRPLFRVYLHEHHHMASLSVYAKQTMYMSNGECQTYLISFTRAYIYFL